MKKAMKIIIPILIMVVVIGIGIYKKWEQDELLTELKVQEEIITDDNFILEVSSIDLEGLLAYNMPMIIDFGAEECGPCQSMAADLLAINIEMQGKAIVKFVDVWKYPYGAGEFPVQVVPTQFFINADGTPYVPSEEITISFLMYGDEETQNHLYTAHQGALSADEMRMILQDMGVEE